jgi:hypothetical protein
MPAHRTLPHFHKEKKSDSTVHCTTLESKKSVMHRGVVAQHWYTNHRGCDVGCTCHRGDSSPGGLICRARHLLTAGLLSRAVAGGVVPYRAIPRGRTACYDVLQPHRCGLAAVWLAPRAETVQRRRTRGLTKAAPRRKRRGLRISGAACRETPSSAWTRGEAQPRRYGAMGAIAQRRPGMYASVVTGQYCSVHQVLFVHSLQEWLSYRPAHIAHAFGDAMQLVEATCPRCLAMAQTAMDRQCPARYTPSCVPVTTGVGSSGTPSRGEREHSVRQTPYSRGVLG